MNKRIRNRSKALGPILATALTTAISLPTITLAQSADATMRGKAPANATVTARNLATGFVRRVTAAADGNYVIAGLPPGTYRVDAGPGTETTVTLLVASTSDVDVSQALEQVTVSASRHTVKQTSEVATIVSQHEIETTPQITRNFLEFADTVPGMVFQTDANGVSTLRGGALATSATNVFIDGVGQKDYVLNGGTSGQDNTQGNPFPQLAIAEYKVVTSNYKAEYGQVSSAAIIAETKSGTNEFHGQAFGNYTTEKLRALTPSEVYNNKQVPSKNDEFGFSFGGPIIQDKMHFFMTYEGKRFSTPKAVTPSVLGLNSLLPASVVAQFGPADQNFTENLAFGKLDFEPTDADRLELQFKWRDEKQVGNVGGNIVPEHGINKKTKDNRVVARWQHSADRWINNLQLTYEDVNWESAPRTAGTNGASYDFVQNPNTSPPDPVLLQFRNIIQAGAAGRGDLQNKGQKGQSVQDDLTFTNLQWHGDHIIKTGILVKKVTLHAQDNGNADPQFSYAVVDPSTAGGPGAPGLGYTSVTLLPNPYEVNFANPSALGISNFAESDTTQIGLYIQDDWKVNDQLTLYPGIRWDYETSPKYLNWVTPQAVRDSFKADTGLDPANPIGITYGQSLAAGGININDYISTGHNRSALKNEWAPRLGLSYDLFGDKRHVITAGIGRSYDRDLFNFMQLEQNKSALGTPTLDFFVPTANGGQACMKGNCIAWNPNYLNGIKNLQALVAGTNIGTEVDMINNHLKAPYSDQFSLGLRSRVADWNLSETVTYVHGKDGFVWLLGNRYPNGAFWVNGGQAWDYGPPGFRGGPLILGTNGVESKTTQLLLEAEKPYTEESGWSAHVAVTLSESKANYSYVSVFPYALNFPTMASYPMVRSDSIAKWRVVTTASVRGPWSTIFGAKLSIAAPTPVFLQDVCLNQPVTGANCSNYSGLPGDTVGYFALDLNANKDFQLGKGISGYVKASVLNVTNAENFDLNSSWLYANGQNYGSNGKLYQPPVAYDRTNNILGWPRTLKLEVGVKF